MDRDPFHFSTVIHNNDQWKVFTTKNSELPSDNIAALTVAPDGALWIGTWGGGLARCASIKRP